jgi:hypothetical protein
MGYGMGYASATSHDFNGLQMTWRYDIDTLIRQQRCHVARPSFPADLPYATFSALCLRCSRFNASL